MKRSLTRCNILALITLLAPSHAAVLQGPDEASTQVDTTTSATRMANVVAAQLSKIYNGKTDAVSEDQRDKFKNIVEGMIRTASPINTNAPKTVAAYLKAAHIVPSGTNQPPTVSVPIQLTIAQLNYGLARSAAILATLDLTSAAPISEADLKASKDMVRNILGGIASTCQTFYAQSLANAKPAVRSELTTLRTTFEGMIKGILTNAGIVGANNPVDAAYRTFLREAYLSIEKDPVDNTKYIVKGLPLETATQSELLKAFLRLSLIGSVLDLMGRA